MYSIKSLLTQNYKNLEDRSWEFSPEVNLITGLNGRGKTNLLDALHILCFTKSALGHNDLQNTKNGFDFFALEGQFHGYFDDQEAKELKVRLAWQKARKKVLFFDGKESDSMGEHIGKLPVVFFSPDDRELIKGGSETRRRFVDSLISQYDKNYLASLQYYNKALEARNKILKEDNPSISLLESFDQQLEKPAQQIQEKRKVFTKEWTSFLLTYYARLCAEKEEIEAIYEPSWAGENFLQSMEANRKKDLALHYTTLGPHRDDWNFSLKNSPLKKTGSQGQIKSFAIAMQLSRKELLLNKIGKPPLLLLDDVFGTLDKERMTGLIELLSPSQHQLFITDARPDDIAEVKTWLKGNTNIITL